MTLLKPSSAQTSTPAPAKSEVERLLSSLGEIDRNSPNLIVNPGGRFESGGAPYELPRYLFSEIRAGIHRFESAFSPLFTVTNRKALGPSFTS